MPLSPDALVVALIGVAALVYARGLSRLWAARRGRGVGVASAAAFAVGLVVLALDVAGPLDEAAHDSFAAHMIEHETLMLVVAPLLVAGRPLATWTWALPRGWRARVAAPFRANGWRAPWRALTSVTGASLLQIAVLFAWHAPSSFDAALGDPWVHAAQHACFLGAALAFCWATWRSARGASALAAIGWLFVTMLATGALGAALAFAPRVWYPAYAHGADALDDQRLGGLLMWVPGGLAYVGAALAIGARMLDSRRAAVNGC